MSYCPQCADKERLLRDATAEAIKHRHANMDLHAALDSHQHALDAARAEIERLARQSDGDRLMAQVLRDENAKLREALRNLVGWLEVASVTPEAIGKVLVMPMDAPELNAARAALGQQP